MLNPIIKIKTLSYLCVLMIKEKITKIIKNNAVYAETKKDALLANEGEKLHNLPIKLCPLSCKKCGSQTNRYRTRKLNKPAKKIFLTSIPAAPS